MKVLASKLVSEEPPEIQELIQKPKKVFQDLPLEMPLQRKIEHIIEVKAGSNPVNIKPYRYPHNQKKKKSKG